MSLLSVALPSGGLVRKTKQLAPICTSSHHFSNMLTEWIWGMNYLTFTCSFREGWSCMDGEALQYHCVCCVYTWKLSVRALTSIACANFDIKVNKH